MTRTVSGWAHAQTIARPSEVSGFYGGPLLFIDSTSFITCREYQKIDVYTNFGTVASPNFTLNYQIEHTCHPGINVSPLGHQIVVTVPNSNVFDVIGMIKKQLETKFEH